jgi:REP element-mobilizing transposase RayT
VSEKYTGQNDHLKRLPKEFYLGFASVHWSLTIEDRRTGWLTAVLHNKFREILTHTAFRHGLAAPIYCCMPDHIHMLWTGLRANCDQLAASLFFRKQMNLVLDEFHVRFQREGYDHVLRDEERERSAFENVSEYIARNPERTKLIPPDRFREYPFTDGLFPGYPELHFRQSDYWERCWRLMSYLRKAWD